MIILILAVAGAVGAVLRLTADHYLPRRGILVANTLGSFVAGVTAGALSGVALDLWVTGVAGALTTFSTVSVSTARDALSGRFAAAVGCWAAHLALGMLAVGVGLSLGLRWS
ncbi:fluoride efflux transporter FluC [Citricoccus nitrophenolicus]|uniref:fluoride efflux transporter FluC n=1 Tax=Citricoccus nitrophenolicus TaxID=863575 RepID=UPI0031F0B1AE